jgi:D-beta-D-heptose 7-phosphate kinase/D-beta-D-heptose 1-phosphate adenosyltransferase
MKPRPARTSPPIPTADLIGLLDRWPSRKIVVAGDFMLDHHVFGNAERLSPDAPVPVLAVQREEFQAGGASNVCLDLRALRCEVACLGVVGDDAPGRRLRAMLRAAGCTADGVLTVPDRPTTVKQNFIGLAQHRHPQKMFRVDRESREHLPAACADRLLAAAGKALRGAAVLCLADYNKGVLTPEVCRRLIALARRRRVPVLVDPAAIDDYRRYAGATCITPNRFEAALAVGGSSGSAPDVPSWRAAARRLLRTLGLDAVVLTLDKHGALLLERGSMPRLMPTQARAVYDVTGAGDMMLAMLAAARARGAAWPAAVELANVAAGLEVEQFGVVPIPLDEVLLFVLSRHYADLGKVRTVAQLLPELAAHRRRGRRIAFTNGCFDILHTGHVRLLRQARATADLLVVAMNTDASIRRIKGPDRPVNRQDDRVLVLSELASVDYVVLYDTDTPKPLLTALRPEVLVKGAEYRKDQVVGHEIVESYGGKIVLADMVQGRSTTNIIRRIAATKPTQPWRRTAGYVSESGR